MLSIIIPVFYERSDSYVVDRAKKIIEKFQNRDAFEVIIADSSKKSYLQSDSANIKIINSLSNGKYFSPAKARDDAVEYASRKYLFFFDVDLDYDDLFEKILLSEIESQLESGKKKFLMIPCLYLSKQGTKSFLTKRNILFLKESLLRGENDLVSRLALNTSALVMAKDYFIEVGKFSIDFKGHGCEDFELIHRLAALDPHSVRNVDYYVDRVEQFPGNYVGFRLYFSYYALPYLFSNLLLVHKWHERPLTNLFYFRRRPNESLLKVKMYEYDNMKTDIWNVEKPFVPIDQYIVDLMNSHNYQSECYPGLFSFKKGVKRQKSTISVKIRKFLTRPKEFFLDSKLLKLFHKMGI